jgi:hypothetical protein
VYRDAAGSYFFTMLAGERKGQCQCQELNRIEWTSLYHMKAQRVLNDL